MFEGSNEFNAAWYISRSATWCSCASFLQLSYSGEKLGGELEEIPIFPSTLPVSYTHLTLPTILLV